jgi:hypothetical protein
MWCSRQDIINFFWEQFDFDTGDWDEGFGYEAPCDVNRPLARTFNALYALYYSSPSPPTRTDDFSGNLLHYGGNYAIDNIDELDGRCGNSTTIGTTGSTQHGCCKDNWTQLYWPFFYGQNVATRAATVLHESRHAAGHSHIAETECTRLGSCDYSWDQGNWQEDGVGANRYEVVWLSWFVVEGKDVGPSLKARAAERANDIIRRGFLWMPQYVVPAPP